MPKNYHHKAKTEPARTASTAGSAHALVGAFFQAPGDIGEVIAALGYGYFLTEAPWGTRRVVNISTMAEERWEFFADAYAWQEDLAKRAQPDE